MAEPANHEDDIEAVIACLEDDAAELRDENPEDERAANMEVAAATIRSLCKQLDDARAPQARPTFEPGEVQELAWQCDLESFAEDVKQLCEDFSSRDGNVYIKDVQASIDALLARYVPGNAGVDVPGGEAQRLVPVKPTPAMLEAGAMRIAMNEQYVATAESKAEAVWRDMVRAAGVDVPQGQEKDRG